MMKAKLKNKEGKSYYSIMPRKDYNYFADLVRKGVDIETAYNTAVNTKLGQRYKGRKPNIRMNDGELFIDVAKRLNLSKNDCNLFHQYNRKLGDPEKALEKVLNNISRRKAAWEKYRMTEENIF